MHLLSFILVAAAISVSPVDLLTYLVQHFILYSMSEQAI